MTIQPSAHRHEGNVNEGRKPVPSSMRKLCVATTALAATVLAGSPPASAAGGTEYTLGADQPVQLSCLLGPLGPEPAEITAHFTGPASAGRGDTVTLTEFGGALTLTGFVSAILQAAGIDGLRGAADGPTFDLSLSASAGSRRRLLSSGSRSLKPQPRQARETTPSRCRSCRLPRRPSPTPLPVIPEASPSRLPATSPASTASPSPANPLQKFWLARPSGAVPPDGRNTRLLSQHDGLVKPRRVVPSQAERP